MKRIAYCFVFAGLVAACHEPFSNEDLVFLKASNQDLRIDLPGDEVPMAQEPMDGPARFYIDTRRAAEEVNEGVFSTFDLVEQMSDQPPSVVEDNRRIFGPIPWDDRGELALVIDRIEPSAPVKPTSTSTETVPNSTFNYIMVARPPGGTDDDYAPIFGGTSHWIDGAGFAMGVLTIDFDTIRFFNPSEEGTGQLFVGFDTRFDQTTIELASDPNVTGTFEPTVAWRYVNEAIGQGSFAFFQRENIIETTAAEEMLVIVARWTPNGRGRADVIVTEGDSVIPWFASECWNEGFQRVYLASNLPDANLMPVGAPSACAPGLQRPPE